MIEFSHDFFVGFAKSFGLFWMMSIFLGAVIYAYWPSNRSKFDRAAESVLDHDQDDGI